MHKRKKRQVTATHSSDEFREAGKQRADTDTEAEG